MLVGSCEICTHKKRNDHYLQKSVHLEPHMAPGQDRIQDTAIDICVLSPGEQCNLSTSSQSDLEQDGNGDRQNQRPAGPTL